MSPTQTAFLALTPALGAFLCLGGLLMANRLLRPFRDRKKFQSRTRAEIIVIGHMVEDEDGLHPSDFVMRFTKDTPFFSYGPDGEPLMGNYTTEELNELIARRKEFE